MPGPLKRPHVGKGFSTLLLQARAGDLVLIAALYRDVRKFGGLKLVVYETSVWGKVDRTSLDPHFYPDDKGPVVRFRPDSAGLGLALTIVPLKGAEREAFVGLVKSFESQS